ncbi:UDP-N-acetylmuramoyl-tripeptide--D-alanyl-D-alanine ligase [Bosea sp. 62]|uniref:UDP-N-acetylmuramoylalanyl-D-glutamyl-2, 6-diaminopimelate--D-alanyl-D-alanine ligase n=1 Tax=unclassified Bosea (in: a-proteobacteria) TaxID=2653178 RepID=UPI001251C2B0|nr:MULTISPECIES: UDP-N-acetylmuramoylalanyl-D-glutamyl-2,6-diaminopimelate--D-alanyl-D-alanine ligase [unclassified Bosea (in: a-proteobacteria)]CAD5246434.1 UDP-N-acetylmuramoyl-tripeptide--D-alanyl-D-alanine ligase [Bosea sp. 7B]CAD5247383.1 UDP-N-acetylmuramoyl-tripeptide--D-alanyl-D-alanine ligase [Bosea sp. 21B]CAD5269909.1 UDP-N-acetylmuramoyl-tripeptide--D-alanyl-D-alanine ligase [Bosea sp. 46]VVT50883.1 UDP-N-acetylmuramoyl-tripeptide--D-alanyl-D-alanine ligase [Bosea sp. EC-HK365B]VXA
MTTEPLWTGARLIEAMGARSQGPVPAAVTGASIDTRTLEPGDAFFAITGEARNGHDFVAAALDKGAALAVVDEAHAGAFPADVPLAIVPDVLRGMEKAGMARRAELSAKVVAVTGSVGKTGTKEALRLVLSRQGKTHAPVASYNNHWGVPLTLTRTPRDVRYGVYEIGMNAPGEILPLAKMVQPDVAVITTIQPVHLAAFESLEGIAREKAAIFNGLKAGGTAIINADIQQTGLLRELALAAGAGRVISFGESEAADVRLLGCALKPDVSTANASVMGRAVTYKLGSPGKHIVLNSLAVLAAAEALGADLALAALALADLTPPSGRGARQVLHAPAGPFTLIDESYNGNPASMRAAIENLGRMPVAGRGRRIAVLGDMLELGETAPELHKGLADAVTGNGIDLVFACGPLMRTLYDALPSHRRGAYAAQASSLEPYVLDAVRAGDVVTVKGSLGTRMGPIVKAMTARFPVVQADD